MRYLLSLTLAAIAALSVAGCATVSDHTAIAAVSKDSGCRRLAHPDDTKIQIYCASGRAWADATLTAARETHSGKTCRIAAWFANDKIVQMCGTPAQWDTWDTWAAQADVTCRLTPDPRKSISRTLWTRGPNEICLSAAQWQNPGTIRNAFASARAVGVRNVTSGWSDSGSSGSAPTGSQAAYATSYGYFPAGTAIGQ